MPPTDLFKLIVDVLSKRYGWFYQDIYDRMYWEDVYEMYEYASNLNTLEKNEDMKFNVVLHAQTKDALKNWRDFPIPYPTEGWKPSKRVKAMPQAFQGKINRVKATPEEKKRFEEVKKRLAETQEKAKELRMKQTYGS